MDNILSLLCRRGGGVVQRIRQEMLFTLSKMGMISSDYLIPPTDLSQSFNISFVKLIYAHSTNNILEISKDSQKFFFRRVREHTPFDNYVIESITDYIALCDDIENKDSFSDYVFSTIRDKSRLKKLVSIRTMFEKSSPINCFLSSNDPRFIGFRRSTSDNLSALDGMVRYLWSELYSYNLNRSKKIGDFQTYSASRMTGEERIAKLLGIEEIITKSSYVTIRVHGKKLVGMLLNDAGGELAKEMIKNRGLSCLSYRIQKDLIALNILDYITYDKDHKPANYMMKVNHEGLADSLCAFDNDCASAFSLNCRRKFNSYFNSSSLINSRGVFARPFIDASLVQKIVNTTESEISNELLPILNGLQIKAVLKRWNNLRDSLLFAKKEKSTEFVDGDWRKEMFDRELFGDYGRTYLRILFDYGNRT